MRAGGLSIAAHVRAAGRSYRGGHGYRMARYRAMEALMPGTLARGLSAIAVGACAGVAVQVEQAVPAPTATVTVVRTSGHVPSTEIVSRGT